MENYPELYGVFPSDVYGSGRGRERNASPSQGKDFFWTGHLAGLVELSPTTRKALGLTLSTTQAG